MRIFYKWCFLRRLLKYTNTIVKPFNRILESKHCSPTSSIEPIFVIGVPRSGTTLLYQILTNYFDVLYTSNLVNLARENLFFSFWLNNKLFKAKPHNCYRSNYGITQNCGLIAPNENPILFSGWQEDRYYPIEDVGKKIAKYQNTHLRLNAILNRFQKKIIVKNFQVNIHLNYINSVFPNAKFIYLYRNSIYTAQSIYKGVLEGRGEIFKDWIMNRPKGYEKIVKFPIIKKIVNYVYLMTKQIETDLQALDQGNVFRISYENLGKELDQIIEELSKSLKLKIRDKIIKPDIGIRNKRNISVEEFQTLKEEINELDWYFTDKMRSKDER